MEQLTLIKEMEILFKSVDKFTDKNGKLFISKILESIDTIDTELIELLISDETAKKHFFTKVKA